MSYLGFDWYLLWLTKNKIGRGLRCWLLPHVDVDTLCMVSDQCLGLDSIGILYPRGSMIYLYFYPSSTTYSATRRLLLLGDCQPWIRSLDFNLFENSRWVPRNDDEVRHIFSDHASGPDCDSPPDSDASKHRHITSEPAVFPNSNWRPQLGAPSPIAQERI